MGWPCWYRSICFISLNFSILMEGIQFPVRSQILDKHDSSTWCPGAAKAPPITCSGTTFMSVTLVLLYMPSISLILWPPSSKTSSSLSLDSTNTTSFTMSKGLSYCYKHLLTDLITTYWLCTFYLEARWVLISTLTPIKQSWLQS